VRPAATVAGARSVWFLANRETHGLAVYAQRLLHQVRDEVRLVDPGFPDPLRSLEADDAVVACTFRPYAKLTLALMRSARERGASLVVVTDGLAHDFIAPPDIVLAVPVESPTLLLSFTPAVCVLETLAARVAMMDADGTHAMLEATGHFVAEHDLVASPAKAARARRTR
jgi:DNA-binding MurR/RpiR family transcriptional regulator